MVGPQAKGGAAMILEPFWLGLSDSHQLQRTKLNRCPQCKSSALVPGQVRIDSMGATQVVFCMGCHMTITLHHERPEKRER